MCGCETDEQTQHRRRGRHADFILFTFHKIGHSQEILQGQRLGSIASEPHLTPQTQVVLEL